MKLNMKITEGLFLIITLLIGTIGCTSKKDDLSLNFPNVQKISFQKVEVPENSLLNPYDFMLFDSLAMLRDKSDGKLLSIIDLNKNKLIKRSLSTGRGPNEIVGGYLFKLNETQIQAVDVGGKKTQLYSIDSILNGPELPVKTIYYDELP